MKKLTLEMVFDLARNSEPFDAPSSEEYVEISTYSSEDGSKYLAEMLGARYAILSEDGVLLIGLNALIRDYHSSRRYRSSKAQGFIDTLWHLF